MATLRSMMKINCTLLSLLFVFTIQAQALKTKPFKAIQLNIEAFIGLDQPDQMAISEIPAFEISEQITWREYKAFLVDLKRTRGEDFQALFLPQLTSKLVHTIIHTETFDKLPAVGISWTNIQYYCQWRTIQDNDNSIEFYYRLPRYTEWLSALYQVRQGKKRLKIDQDYADWTTRTYDESIYSFVKSMGHDYEFPARPTDPPALKRKIAMGASYRYQFNDLKSYHDLLYFYQDSGYAHIGFRLVKVNDQSHHYRYSNWMADQYPKFWSLFEGFDFTRHELTLDRNRVICYEDGGLVSGQYQSFYRNGQLKAKGLFYRNQRSGPWTYWDSTGQKVLSRNYTSSLTYETLFPKPKDNQMTILQETLGAPMTTWDRRGFLRYAPVQERAVKWSKRVWSRIDSVYTPFLFKNAQLRDHLIAWCDSGKIQAYDVANDQFKTMLSAHDFKTKIGNYAVDHYLLKGDYFFDMDRQVMDYRPIGICPVVKQTEGTESKLVQTAWFYFPQLREYLAQLPAFGYTYSQVRHVMTKQKMPELTYQEFPYSADALFYYQHYRQTVVKTSSWRAESNSEKDHLTFFAEILEQEHDFLIELYHQR